MTDRELEIMRAAHRGLTAMLATATATSEELRRLGDRSFAPLIDQYAAALRAVVRDGARQITAAERVRAAGQGQG
jgi:hypothetical protein